MWKQEEKMYDAYKYIKKKGNKRSALNEIHRQRDRERAFKIISYNTLSSHF